MEGPKIRIGERVLDLPTQDDMDLGEVAVFEDMTGTTFGDDGVPRGKALAALIYIARVRAGDPVTRDDVYKVKFGDIEYIAGVTDNVPPEEAGKSPGDSENDASDSL